MLATNLPLTFPSFLGILSLSGMLIKNCIVLIDEIDKGEKVIIIDKGKVLESGDVSKVIKKTKTKNIRDAFNKLVGIK